MEITVLCPTRGNPDAFAEAATSMLDTRMEDTTQLVAVVDEDDPKLGDYLTVVTRMAAFTGSYPLAAYSGGVSFLRVPPSATGNMNKALNYAVELLLAYNALGDEIIGFVGDDHRFRTKGWDRIVNKILTDESGGILYGDDLAQRHELPTQVFITSEILRALGWMGLPGAKHLYLDNTWKTLGEGADCLIYCPDIVIEHMHPAYGKGEWDEGHLRVNAQEVYQHDALIYEAWIKGQMVEDVERVRRALSRA